MVSRRKLTVKPTRVSPTTYRLDAKTYTQHRDGKTVTVHRPAQTVHKEGYMRGSYQIVDRGNPGRGPKLFEVKNPGKMTKVAMDLGYIKEGEKITDIPLNKIDDFARSLARRVGAKSALGMFQAQVNFRKNVRTESGRMNRRKFEAGRDAIAKAFGPQLKPEAAIRANLRRGENKRGPG